MYLWSFHITFFILPLSCLKKRTEKSLWKSNSNQRHRKGRSSLYCNYFLISLWRWRNLIFPFTSAMLNLNVKYGVYCKSREVVLSHLYFNVRADSHECLQNHFFCFLCSLYSLPFFIPSSNSETAFHATMCSEQK